MVGGGEGVKGGENIRWLNHHILLNAESCRFAVGRGGGGVGGL